MPKNEDWQDEEMDSIEDIRESELDESETEEFEAASGDFKALFDDAEDLLKEEDDEEDSFLDDTPLSMSDAEKLSSEEADEDKDSLSLEEAGINEVEMLASSSDESDPIDQDSAGVPEEISKKNSAENLAQAFEQMSSEAIDIGPAGEEAESLEFSEDDEDAQGELEVFESAEIEEKEFVDADSVVSVVESVLFSTDKAVGIAYIKRAFEGTTVKTDQVKRAIETLQIEYASSQRGVFLEEVSGGYQLRTKVDNLSYLKRIVKGKPFKLSGPALEVLAIAAYKQPLIKAEVDEIRGVESGHLMRALMDRGLMRFAGKSELPGKPMLYETTKKFLEIFSLRSLKELPSLSEIDELIPEGIGEEEEEKEHLSSVTDNMSVLAAVNYSEGEEELGKIEETLGQIDTTTEFFEQEKAREKARQEKDRADGIREALDFAEDVATKDKKWLERYDKKIEEQRLEAERIEEKRLETKGREEEELASLSSDDSENLEPSSATQEVSDLNQLQTREQSETVEISILTANEEQTGDESDEPSGDESEELFADSSSDSLSTEDLSTKDVDKSDDESELFFSESPEADSTSEGDESDLLFAEEDEPTDTLEEINRAPEKTEVLATQEEAIESAFGNIQNALEAFESEDGIDIDTPPESIGENLDSDTEPEATT